MAYDKVVDSTELDAGLSAVADAIREKSGESERLVFPGGFVSAIMEISTGGNSGGAVSGEVHDVSIAADVNNGSVPLVTGSEFAVKNYTKDGFMAVLINPNPPSASSGTMLSIVHGNCNLGSSNVSHYGYYASANGTMSVSGTKITTKIKEAADGIVLYVSAGAVWVQTAYSTTLPAGNYKLVLLCFDI